MPSMSRRLLKSLQYTDDHQRVIYARGFPKDPLYLLFPKELQRVLKGLSNGLPYTEDMKGFSIFRRPYEALYYTEYLPNNFFTQMFFKGPSISRISSNDNLHTEDL